MGMAYLSNAMHRQLQLRRLRCEAVSAVTITAKGATRTVKRCSTLVLHVVIRIFIIKQKCIQKVPDFHKSEGKSQKSSDFTLYRNHKS